MSWPNYDLHMSAPNGAELHAEIFPPSVENDLPAVAEVVFLRGDASTWLWDAEACALAATFFTELARRMSDA